MDESMNVDPLSPLVLGEAAATLSPCPLHKSVITHVDGQSLAAWDSSAAALTPHSSLAPQ